MLFEHNESADNAIFSYMGFPQELRRLQWSVDLGFSWNFLGETTRTPRIGPSELVGSGDLKPFLATFSDTTIFATIRFRNSPAGAGHHQRVDSLVQCRGTMRKAQRREE